jgi:hypothetical protein
MSNRRMLRRESRAYVRPLATKPVKRSSSPSPLMTKELRSMRCAEDLAARSPLPDPLLDSQATKPIGVCSWYR